MPVVKLARTRELMLHYLPPGTDDPTSGEQRVSMRSGLRDADTAFIW
ncbi:MAG: hypothetical protein ACK2UI_11370 [Anaerolineae bacterium]